MDFDFLDKRFLNAAKKVVLDFRTVVEEAQPPEADLEKLCAVIVQYGHAPSVEADFKVAGVDGSGEFPILQQDDIFVHLAIAAGVCYKTQSNRQHKLSSIDAAHTVQTDFAILQDRPGAVVRAYEELLGRLTGLPLKDIVRGSDYCDVFNAFARKSNRLRRGDVTWDSFAFSKAAEVGTHGYQLRSLAELSTAVRLLTAEPKYLLIDTSLVYFLLGESLYLPEVVKRYLVCRALEQGTAVVGLCKSHNIPNGDLIGRRATEQFGFKDHWYLRLPAESLGEQSLPFLQEREIPPKLGVSYLFKFHETSFPMRIDVDAEWWKKHVADDAEAEKRLFRDLDFTCHDVRSYGYPYPLHAAHRSASLTRQERKAIRDVLLQNAQEAGVLRGAFMREPESVHMSGI